MIERYSCNPEMKTRERNRNNKRTEIKQFDWFIERIQMHLAFGWLSERSAEKTSCPKNFLEIALTSYCHTIGQSNNAFSILGYSLTWRFHSRGVFTHVASIYANRKERKRLHKKRVQLPEYFFGTPTWPPFNCFGKNQYGRRDVM